MHLKVFPSVFSRARDARPGRAAACANLVARLAGWSIGASLFLFTVFDGGVAGPSDEGSNALRLQRGGEGTLLAQSPIVELRDTIVRTELVPTGDLRANVLPDAHHIRLVMRKMSAAQQPGVSFGVYLGLARDAPSDQAHYVNTLNFYGAVMIDGGPAKQQPVASFDVTELLHDLVSSRAAVTELWVAFVPDGVPAAGSSPRIEAIELIEE